MGYVESLSFRLQARIHTVRDAPRDISMARCEATDAPAFDGGARTFVPHAHKHRKLWG